MGGTESTQVTAGIWGFLVLFGLALACWFLFRSMNSHLRRMRYSEREQAQHGNDAFGQPLDAPHGSSERPGPDDDPIGAPGQRRHTR